MTLKARVYNRLQQWALKRYHREIKRVIDEDKLKFSNIRVTDHSLLRYAERVEGFDIQKARSVLLGDSLAKRVAKLGDGCYSVGSNTVVVKNRTIVTVYPHNGRVDWRISNG